MPKHCLITSITLALVFPILAQGNELTIYSAGPRGLIDDLANGFENSSGIEVSVFQSTTGQVMARIESERSRPSADVVISASWESAEGLKKQGLLMEYTPAGADTVPAELKTGHYIAQGSAALAIVWNRASDVPAPSDWSDLTRSEYRNQVTMPDPSQSGAAFQLVAALLTHNGSDQTWKLMGNLKNNGMIVPGPNARALNPVLQGAKSVVFGAVDYIALTQKDNGENIEVIFPDSGTVFAHRPAMILKDSGNPDAARRFMDYMLSEEGQEQVAKRFLIPAREDIQARRPVLKDLKQLSEDPDAAESQREKIIRMFREVMNP